MTNSSSIWRENWPVRTVRAARVHLNETLFLTPLATEVPRDHPICLRHPGKLQQLGVCKKGATSKPRNPWLFQYGIFMDFLDWDQGKSETGIPRSMLKSFFYGRGFRFQCYQPNFRGFHRHWINNGVWNRYIYIYIRKLKSPRNRIFMQTPGVLEEIWWFLNICFMYVLFFEHHENLIDCRCFKDEMPGGHFLGDTSPAKSSQCRNAFELAKKTSY